MFRFSAIAAVLTTASATLAGETQAPKPPAASDFALMAAQSDEYEIQAGRTAAVQAVDPRVRAFAKQMVEDHLRARQELGEAAIAAGLQAPPPALSGDQAMLLGALQSQRGSQFDRTYMRQQVLAHQQALAVEQTYAAGGSMSALREAAVSAVPLIQHHLQMARTLDAALSAP